MLFFGISVDVRDFPLRLCYTPKILPSTSVFLCFWLRQYRTLRENNQENIKLRFPNLKDVYQAGVFFRT